MPNERLTYKQIVHKIIYDSGYAREIADLIARARKNDEAARREIEKRFDPQKEELEELGLSKKALSCVANPQFADLFKTDTTFLLLDFARMLY